MRSESASTSWTSHVSESTPRRMGLRPSILHSLTGAFQQSSTTLLSLFAKTTLEPVGHTRLRDHGDVVSIPFFEWDKLRRHDDRDAYVRQRIKTIPAVAHAICAPTPPPSHGPASSTASTCTPWMTPKPALWGVGDGSQKRYKPRLKTPSHAVHLLRVTREFRPVRHRARDRELPVPLRTSATSAAGTTVETAEVRISEDGGSLAVVAGSASASAPRR